jgi:hypothetical protein
MTAARGADGRDLEACRLRERGEPVLGVPVQLPRPLEDFGAAIAGRLVAQDRGLQPVFVVARLRHRAHPLHATVVGHVLTCDAELFVGRRIGDEQRHQGHATLRKMHADTGERGERGLVVRQQVERRAGEVDDAIPAT